MPEKELKKITRIIADKCAPKKIILFGSFAWGKPDKNSDFDLFIVQETTKPKFVRAREIRQSLFGQNFPALDLLVYTPKELAASQIIGDPFIFKIINEGRLIYES